MLFRSGASAAWRARRAPCTTFRPGRPRTLGLDGPRMATGAARWAPVRRHAPRGRRRASGGIEARRLGGLRGRTRLGARGSKASPAPGAARASYVKRTVEPGRSGRPSTLDRSASAGGKLPRAPSRRGVRRPRGHTQRATRGFPPGDRAVNAARRPEDRPFEGHRRPPSRRHLQRPRRRAPRAQIGRAHV